MEYGFKVSVEGKDVSLTNVDDFVIHSSYSSVKIYKEGSGSIAVTAGSTNGVTIAHNLGFIPICTVYTENEPGSGQWYFGADTILSHPEDASLIITGTYVDNTNLVLTFVNDAGTGNKTMLYRYYIFADDGA